MFTLPTNVQITVLPMTLPRPVDRYEDKTQRVWASQEVMAAVMRWLYTETRVSGDPRESLSTELGEDWWSQR